MQMVSKFFADLSDEKYGTYYIELEQNGNGFLFVNHLNGAIAKGEWYAKKGIPVMVKDANIPEFLDPSKMPVIQTWNY